MQVYEAVSELIHRTGQTTVFGLVGSSNVAWVGHGVETERFRFVRTRHEAASVSAAAANARITNKTAFATTTLGPGFANTLNALLATVRDHMPIVVITGQSPTNKSHGSQNIDQQGIVEAAGAGFRNAAAPEELEAAFWDAYRDATFNGTPQVLSFDENMLDAEIELSIDPASVAIEPQAPDGDAVRAAIDELARAEHPLILAGWGALRADCRDELIALGERVGARFISTMNANRFFSGHERDLGICGTSSPPIVLEELYRTDVLLAVGASLNGHTTGGGGLFPAATIIQCEVDVDRDFKASSPELGLLGDARLTTQALIDEWDRRDLGTRPVNGGLLTLDKLQASVRTPDIGRDPDRGLDPRDVYARLNELLPADRIVVTDGGRAGHSLPTLLDARDAHSWVPSRGHGSIGLGLGAAIGAAASAPDRHVALFCGDGGFMMAAQELDAIRLNQLNLTIVVMNDEQYGSEVKYLRKFGLPLDIAQQSMPDSIALARTFGGDGVILSTDEDLANLELASGLFLVEARIDPNADGRAV